MTKRLLKTNILLITDNHLEELFNRISFLNNMKKLNSNGLKFYVNY